MFFLFICWPVFYFNHLGTPIGIYPENFVKNRLDLAEIYRILKNVYLFDRLFVCLYICWFFDLIIVKHPQKVPLKILLICLFFALIIVKYPQEVSLKDVWRSDLIWQRYLGFKNVYLFVCLFVDLFFLFLGHPQEVTLKLHEDPTWFGWGI